MIEKSFFSKKANNYNDYLVDIFNWINEDLDFATKFPGINIELTQNKILFTSSNNFDFYNLK